MDLVLWEKCLNIAGGFWKDCLFSPNVYLRHVDAYGYSILSPGLELVGAVFKKHGQKFLVVEARYVRSSRATSQVVWKRLLLIEHAFFQSCPHLNFFRHPTNANVSDCQQASLAEDH
jgi:hypothetical protein